MAVSTSHQRNSYPLPAYNFKVSVGGVSMRFSRVSGLEREHQILTYRHGLSFAEGEKITSYYRDQFSVITLEQGAVIGRKSLYEWLKAKEVRPMEVSLCDETGTPVISWQVAKALPVKLTAPTFDAATNEVSVDTLEVQAAGISVTHHE